MISTLARALLVFLMWPSKKGYLMLVLSPWTLISQGLFFFFYDKFSQSFLFNEYVQTQFCQNTQRGICPPTPPWEKAEVEILLSKSWAIICFSFSENKFSFLY